jgi:arylsulfatase A-like enzyme
MAKKLPNVLFFGIDSLRADHMSLYGYPRLTTPHLDKYLQQGAVFTKHFCPSVPTTSGYASMLTGKDCFGTNVVALRHKGDLAPEVKTLAEILGENGYNTTCVGFRGNPASRGFQKYIDYTAWGGWEQRPLRKAENLNVVAIPELERLAKEDQPFFLFLRHMDPHSPYLPPAPFDRMFYGGDEFDPNNHSLDPVYEFKPFCDYFASWFPPGCTDKDYIIAQYDGEVAYMDACIAQLLVKLESLGLDEDTLVVVTSDHGETLYDHDCYFDHHGLYDCTLYVPLAFKMPGRVPAGVRYDHYSQHKDVVPTVLDILGVEAKDLRFDGRSLAPLFTGQAREQECEFYITEATWMRKHGWRTPQWKLIHALEPDFHFKPEVELYNLINDPEENNNLAESEPDIVKMLEERMQAHIRKREAETGRTNPIYTNLDWHGKGGGPFKTSQQAYDSLHIGNAGEAKRLQALKAKEQGAK